jgi:hypothetical protein
MLHSLLQHKVQQTPAPSIPSMRQGSVARPESSDHVKTIYILSMGAKLSFLNQWSNTWLGFCF